VSTVEIPEYERVHYGEDHSETRGETIRTASGVRVIHLGSNPPMEDNKPILWTNSHTLNETLMIVQTSTSRESRDSRTMDPSLVAVEVPLHYTVSDVSLYDQFGSPAARDEILKAIGRREVMQYLSSITIDDMLGEARSRIAADLRERLNEAYGRLNGGRGAGIEILFVGAEGVHPPQGVAIHFEGVVQEKQRREAAIEDAQRYKIEVLSRTAGTVSRAERVAGMLDELDVLSRSGGSETDMAAIRVRIQHELEQAGGTMGARLIEASAQRWTRHMNERGLAALHAGQVASYDAAPDLYRAKKYFDALREAMADARVYVVPEELAWIRFQLEDQGTTDIFDPSSGAPQ
jgi:regulator of protease activity HflC (stomatin/prohibitin superfamily)